MPLRDHSVVVVPPDGVFVLEVCGGAQAGQELSLLQARNVTAAGISAMLSTYFDNSLITGSYTIKVWPA